MGGTGRLTLLGLAPDEGREKMARLFTAVAPYVDIVGPVAAALNKAQLVGLMALQRPRRNRSAWVTSAGLSPAAFGRRTDKAHQFVEAHAATDGVLMMQTLFHPGATKPFVVYTDWTFALSRRDLRWTPLGANKANRLVELEAQVCRDARLVLTSSEVARQSAITDYGCNEGNVVSISAGTQFGAPPYRERSSSAPPVVIFVGVDWERKGGPALARAWTKARERVPRAELWVVGPSQRPSDLPPDARFFGRLPAEEVKVLYGQASVFCMPSVLEPFGLVFGEAMGFGLPCVGTTVDAIPEIITDGETGMLVSPGSDDELAAALVTLLTDHELRVRMGREAQRRAATIHTWESVGFRAAQLIYDRFDREFPTQPASGNEQT